MTTGCILTREQTASLAALVKDEQPVLIELGRLDDEGIAVSLWDTPATLGSVTHVITREGEVRTPAKVIL